MEVLHVFKAIYPDSIGGIEKVVKVLSEGLYAEHGTRSIVLGVSKSVSDIDTTEFHDGGIKTIKIPEWFSLGSMPVPQIRPFIKEYKKAIRAADIVHYHFPWPIGDLIDRLFNRKNKKPTIVTYQSDIVKQRYMMVVYRPLMKLFLRSVDSIVAASENYLKTSKVLKQYENKVRIIPNGLEKIDSSEETFEISDAYKKRFSKGYFLFVGAPRYYKGLTYLIEAARGVDFDVVIAGQGEELESYIQLADDKGLGNIHFLGRVSEQEKSALIHGCKALVLPSIERSEAFGLILVEALSAGKPLLSTFLGTGTSFINQDGVTGIVVQAKNTSALKEAMTELYISQKQEEYSSAALMHYCNHFTVEIMVNRYQKLYESLLD